MTLYNVTKLIALAQLLHNTKNILVEISVKQNGPEMAANEQVPEGVLLDVTAHKNCVRVRVDGKRDGFEYEDLLEARNRYIARLEGLIKIESSKGNHRRAAELRQGAISAARWE